MKFVLLQDTLINLDEVVCIKRYDAGSPTPGYPITALPHDVICFKPGWTISYTTKAARDRDWQWLLNITEPKR